MKVDLINLGDSTRVLYDRRQLPVVIGVGKVVCADLTPTALDAISRHADSETLVVTTAGDGRIPEELKVAVDLLAVIDFEEYNTLLRRFNTIIQIDDSTRMRPNRMQMRVALKNKVEDYVRAAARQRVRDDVDPAKLEQERSIQEQREKEAKLPPPSTPEPPPPPPHALKAAQAAALSPVREGPRMKKKSRR